MKLRIRKGTCSWSLIDENGSTAAKIKNIKPMGTAKEIIDAKGKVIFITDIVNLREQKEDENKKDIRKYVLYKDSVPVATANLTYAENPDNAKARNFIQRPPQVVKMDVETPYGPWIIQRQKNNSLVIMQNDVPVGNVSPFFTLKPMYLDFMEDYEVVFLAGIYVFIEYMMREEDVTVV